MNFYFFIYFLLVGFRFSPPSVLVGFRECRSGPTSTDQLSDNPAFIHIIRVTLNGYTVYVMRNYQIFERKDKKNVLLLDTHVSQAFFPSWSALNEWMNVWINIKVLFCDWEGVKSIHILHFYNWQVLFFHCQRLFHSMNK